MGLTVLPLQLEQKGYCRIFMLFRNHRVYDGYTSTVGQYGTYPLCVYDSYTSTCMQ